MNQTFGKKRHTHTIPGESNIYIYVDNTRSPIATYILFQFNDINIEHLPTLSSPHKHICMNLTG